MLSGIGHLVKIELLNIVTDLCRLQGNNNLSIKSDKFYPGAVRPEKSSNDMEIKLDFGRHSFPH